LEKTVVFPSHATRFNCRGWSGGRERIGRIERFESGGSRERFASVNFNYAISMLPLYRLVRRHCVLDVARDERLRYVGNRGAWLSHPGA
jgi:hypothetical protein